VEEQYEKITTSGSTFGSDTVAESLVPHRLLAPVRDMRAHGRQPFEGREYLAGLAIF